MNTDTLKKIFQSPFNYPIYSREIVHSLFGCDDVLTQPELIETSSLGDSSHYVGQMEDAEGRLLGFFYTRVAEGSDVRRKRVGLRKLIQPYLRYEVDAAIAVFDDGQHWRLSYICDHKEGTTSAKRFSYVLGDKQGQYKTPLERLDKVAAKVGHFKMEDLRDAFSVDALSKEFFDEYHRHYDRILKTTVELISKDPTLYSGLSKLFADYIKKMMGRIVFLHFLQKKGWLNGDPDFLKNLFFMQPLDRREDFLEQVLEPLFFGIFNTEPQNREKLFRDEGWDVQLLDQWKGLPYLNGGLFERDSMDTAKLKLPASLFEQLFEFMASYNFTVDENDPDDADIGVDPEMLGKIFESLLEDNKAKGAFYTPKEIVRYMCKESLIAYLGTQATGLSKETGEQASSLSKVFGVKATSLSKESGINAIGLSDYIRKFVEQHEFPEELEPYREVLDTALRNVKICDPAIGSGAFPMGLLNELWRCREALEERATSPSLMGTQANGLSQAGSLYSKEGQAGSLNPYSRAALKREIIENNIYGVDIEKGAIDIARLRFWLSIVVDAEKPEPLPNFDYKFMQGNSLIESFGGYDLSHIMDKKVERNGKTYYQRRIGGKEPVQVSIDFSTEDTRKNLMIWLTKYFSLTDHQEKSEYRKRINESVKSYIKQQCIGSSAEAKLDTLDPSANQDFFLWHTWFKDIFDNGGFDIVIGNPPYISAPTQVANETLAMQRERIVSSKRYKSLYQKWDLYIPFIELGIILNVPSGVTTMIVPYPLTNQLYAKILRKMLVENNDMYELVDLNGTKIFENATVSNCIPFIKKTKTHGETWISKIDEHLKISRSFLQSHEDLVQDKNTYVWNVTQEKREANRHSKMHVLGDYCYISKGMVLNSDENEDVEVFKKADLISEKKDNVHCRKFIEGKDCGKYVANRIRYLEYDTERVPNKCSRPTFRELYLNPKLMFNRLGELQVFYDEYGDFATSDAMFVCLLWKSLAQVNNKSISASIKKFCSFPRHELEKLSEDVDLRYLLGIMNSKYAAVLLTNLRGGDYHIYPEHIRNIPIPNSSKSQQQLIINLVDKILSAKKDNPQANTSALEREIDQQVYALYNLTPEEIAIIEQ